jgi:hypothetical protein
LPSTFPPIWPTPSSRATRTTGRSVSTRCATQQMAASISGV